MTKKPEIKAIIFDWGGVLIDNPAEGLISYCSEVLGMNKTEYNQAFEKFNIPFWKGLIDESTLWDQFCNKIGIERPKQPTFWREAFKGSYKEKKEVFDLAKKLKKAGYKIGFLSNTEKPSMDFFQEQNYNIFDVKIFSCAEHMVKPDSEIYFLVLKRLNIKPQEAVFIDDRLDYTEGAKKIGVQDILFKDVDQLKEALRSYSVKV